MVTRSISIGMDRVVKLRGGGQSHEHYEQGQQDRCHASGTPEAETRDCPYRAHILPLDGQAAKQEAASRPWPKPNRPFRSILLAMLSWGSIGSKQDGSSLGAPDPRPDFRHQCPRPVQGSPSETRRPAGFANSASLSWFTGSVAAGAVDGPDGAFIPGGGSNVSVLAAAVV